MGPVLALLLASACLHAAWNLLAHRHGRAADVLPRVPFVVAAVGLVPALFAELRAPALSPFVVALLALTGAAQAVYYVALGRAYAGSDFSLAYPLSRAAPVLLLALVDLARGHPPSAAGVLGLALIVAGCVLAPLPSLRAFSPALYRGPAARWIALCALATAVFTVVDKAALDALPAQPAMAARYAVWEAVATAAWLTPLVARRPRASWGWAAVAAALGFASYGLALLAFRMSARTSDVAALRQVSVPLGVLASRVVLGERPAPLRVAAALAVTAGVAAVVLGGR